MEEEAVEDGAFIKRIEGDEEAAAFEFEIQLGVELEVEFVLGLRAVDWESHLIGEVIGEGCGEVVRGEGDGEVSPSFEAIEINVGVGVVELSDGGEVGHFIG